MKKIITPETDMKEKKVVAPSLQTLELLKQFARIYKVEQKLPAEFGGMCVN